MNPRILFVSTYSELSDKARNLSEKLGVPVDISEGGILSDGHLYAKSVAHNYDVMVSQGGTALTIRQIVDIPVVTVRITILDFMLAFDKARKYSKPLAIICYRGELETELRHIAEAFLDVPYTIYTYSNKEEFVLQTGNVFSHKGHTVMGFGGCAQDLAMRNGLDYVLITSKKENIEKALIDAKNIVEANKKAKIRSRRLRNLIHYSSEGIISCDKDHRITEFNASAERILGVKRSDVIGKRFTEDSIPQAMRTLFDDGSFAVNKIVKFDRSSLVVNRVPLDVNNQIEESILTFQDVSDIQKLEITTRMQLHEKGLVAKNTFDNIVGVSRAIRETVDKARRFSQSAASILIEGVTGTGKELFAQSIHNASPRAKGPFVAINCAALPETLLESELFGYDQGAFTGAKKGGKLGLFELAHDGTIFLDEISEISSAMQKRLLRVLQEKEVLRVGGSRIININVRVISATNRKLYQMVRDGSFRQDLYFRLSLLNLSLPTLKARWEDIPDLAQHFADVKKAEHGKEMDPLPASFLTMLKDYSWPGNIRELECFIEKLVVLYDEGHELERFCASVLREHVAMHEPGVYDDAPEACAHDLGAFSQGAGAFAHLPGETSEQSAIVVRPGPLKDMQAQLIESLLARHGGNKKRLAQELGVSRTTLWKKLAEFQQ